MFLRRAWVLLVVLCLGCSSLGPVPLSRPEDERGSAGRQLWDEGQLAMARGDPDEAIACYERSLAADPTMVRNHLSLAAAFLEKGEEAPACPHLAAYVAASPEHLEVRSYYAELLLRLNRREEARKEFERFDADAQEQGPASAAPRIHCHTRLMEIAEETDDAYELHLHRGIGLFLLAQERAELPDPEGRLSTEGLLCQAATELTLARSARPEEARPCWYLHEVWSALGQSQPAARSLREADAAAPFATLTPAEERGLQRAWRERQIEGDRAGR